MAIIDKVRSLISAANTKTGESDTTLTDAVQTLVDGYGQGGGTTPAPQKDVNFIDYDGTILHSYTAAEFAALTAMPANPDHSSNITWGGETIALTSQGWNYTLAKAQAYVAKYGKLWIGQMYIPTDGKTYVCIHLNEGRTSPMLGLCLNGTVDVDWGDGTTHNTLTGTDLETVEWTPTHEYAAAGDYVIKLDVTSGTAQIYGSMDDMASCLLRYASGKDMRNQGYANSIQSIFIGDAIIVGDAALIYCFSLNTITIPDGVTSIGYFTFAMCHSLNTITIPDGVTVIGEYEFYQCSSLNAIAIPDSVAGIGTYAFYYCPSLNTITIPDGVTSIGESTFAMCQSLNTITIPDGVTVIGDDAFAQCSSLNAIAIPDSVAGIGTYAFYYCPSLNTITIPDGVTSIGNAAFYECFFLSSVTFESATPPDVSNSTAWMDIPTDCIIYVPAASLDTYKAATNYPDPATYTYIGY